MGEILLWKQLSARKCCGLQFNRQKPLGKYIVDFYCKAVNLVIEIDGYRHRFENIYKKDISRQKDLEAMGLTVLRFSEGEALNKHGSGITGYHGICAGKQEIPLTPFSRGKEFRVATQHTNRFFIWSTSCAHTLLSDFFC